MQQPEFSPVDLPVEQRRLVVFTTREKLASCHKTDYLAIGNHCLAEVKSAGWKQMLTGNGLAVASKVAQAIAQNPADFKKNRSHIVFELANAKDRFQFPPQHPQEGIVYACCDLLPDTYVPVATFHSYMHQSKMSAFMELCAGLGAKRYALESCEETDRKASIGITLPIPMIPGLNLKEAVTRTGEHTMKQNLGMSFPEPTRIQPSTNQWLNAEPTWQAMQRIRLEQDIDTFRAEFDCTDSMGIDAEVGIRFKKLGIDIGGNFQDVQHKRMVFLVEFWPKPKA